jgi:hypothetical protein
MDELDRIYRRLVQNVRAGFPEYLAKPFEVSLIYQQIVPYRHNRRELGIDTNDDYELALTQLLSGARGFMVGDDEMQRALRKELESANPDLTAYRAFATSVVSFARDPLRELELSPMVRPVSGSQPSTRPGASEQAVMASRTTEGLDMSRAPVAPRPVAGGAAPAMATTRPTAPAAGGCHYCGGALPDGRKIVFCPHCGHNLTVQHCPACSTELELGWKFCVTCGREVGAS